MIILGIETSCDETAAAIVQDGTKIIANIVASSQDLHIKTKGVIPEVAAREQLKCIIPVIKETLVSLRHPEGRSGVTPNRLKDLQRDSSSGGHRTQNDGNQFEDDVTIKLLVSLSKSAKKVENDIWHLSFNTAIASLMELMNDFYSNKEKLTIKLIKDYLILLAPFAPFTAEELWQKINHLNSLSDGYNSIHQQPWPVFDEKLLIDEEVVIAIQINGKLRDTMKVQSEKCKVQSYIEELARNREKVAQFLKGKKIIKIIYISGRLINFVV